MKTSQGIQVVFSIALQEARFTGFREIETEHFLVGILKFATIPDNNLRVLVKETNLYDAIRQERMLLSDLLNVCGISTPGASTVVYRQLRESLRERGAEKVENPAGHRSESLKKIFNQAEISAKSRKSLELDLSHLLIEILAYPSELMKAVFKNTRITIRRPANEDRKNKPKAAWPVLEGRLPEGDKPLSPPDPLTIVLQRKLGKNKSHKLLLVNHSRENLSNRVQTFLDHAMRTSQNKGTPPYRICRIGLELFDSDAYPDGFYSACRKIASLGEGMILYLETIDHILQQAESSEIEPEVEKLLGDQEVCLMAGIDKQAYADTVQRYPMIIELFTIIRVHDNQADRLTTAAVRLMDRTREIAMRLKKEMVDVKDFLMAIRTDPHALLLLAEVLMKGNWQQLLSRLPEPKAHLTALDRDLPISDHLSGIFERAKNLASSKGLPDHSDPGFTDISHLACAIAGDANACHEYFGVSPVKRHEIMAFLSAWYDRDAGEPSISGIMDKLRTLRRELASAIFGQDHAIHAFIEGLYNMEIAASGDEDRKRPRGVFVFAGPPGVGKTFLTEIVSKFLRRPYRRFDMTAYADPNTVNQLIGFAPSYKGAEPGLLTDFVDQHPESLLLFDEIEKAHLQVIQLFYQILDAGRLQDNFTKKDIGFRDSIIIFTTNAGRSLYENPNCSGINAAHPKFHRKTILNALLNEKNPSDGRPAFPAPICSRLGQGYPILFNHLGVNELVQIAESSLVKTGRLLSRRYRKLIFHDELLPISIVLKEGANIDARQLSAAAEKFYKTELLNFCSMYDQTRLDEVFARFDKIQAHIELPEAGQDESISALLQPAGKPKVLLMAEDSIATLFQETIIEVEWLWAETWEQASALIAVNDVDMALLDIWFRDDSNLLESQNPDMESVGARLQTIGRDIDFVPLAARRLEFGRSILMNLHQCFPELPVYLLSWEKPQEGTYRAAAASAMNADEERFSAPTLALTIDACCTTEMNLQPDRESRRPIDDELLLACTRSGGARGLVAATFYDLNDWNAKAARDQLAMNITSVCRRLDREKKAANLSRERKVIEFDTVSVLDEEKRTLNFLARNFRFTRVVDAADAGRLVDDVERPATRFADVIGATAAKEALGFIIDWLADPKRFSALGLRTPKGILLAGPPGTGKTLLARALAGESKCAFIEKPASSFVTKWVGSGPENVRELFARARRYAPTIVFIDELDSIGLKRTGGEGGGSARSQEETLNAILTEMDGFNAPKSAPVIVLSATNLADRLDPALRRRFDRVITVDKPDRAARKSFFEKMLLGSGSNRVTPIAIDRLAGRSAGMTLADLQAVIQQAGIMAAQTPCELNDEILEQAFERIRMGEERKIPSPEVLKRTAYHEAGHTLIAYLGGNLPVQVTIVGRGNAGGYMERETMEETGGWSKPELEQLICEAMAGRAAEIVVYGEEQGQATGISGDLRHATGLAQKMAAEFAMSDEIGYAFLDERQLGDGPISIRLLETVEKIVRKQLDRAILRLKEKRSALDDLAAALLERNRLLRAEIIEILGAPDGN